MGSSEKKTSFKLPIVLALIGIIIVSIPLVSDIYETHKANESIQVMSMAYEPLDDPARLKVLENAHSYNDRLAGIPNSSAIEPYEQQLVFNGITQMGWISIPAINVNLPVYHGTDEKTLTLGAGHLEGTSLPVGGPSTHSVITGHSGLQNERIFDDLRKLSEGDVFILHVLGEPYAYRIYSIETVWPYETDSLGIETGEDLCTLLTCTPYGINDHRLLVHGKRCEYLPEMEKLTTADAISSYVNNRTVPFIAALGFLLVVLLAVILILRHGKRNH